MYLWDRNRNKKESFFLKGKERMRSGIAKVGRERAVILILSLALATLITGGVLYRIKADAAGKMQNHLAQEVLRFHILANSDDRQDQNLKIKVRDRVLAYMEEEMPSGLDIKETKDWVRRHADTLETLSRKVVREEGFDYPVNAAVTTCWFPEKTYGDVTFPEGNYEALRMEIGAAQGHNWWCVLYPNLCFADAVHPVVTEAGKQKLKQVLTEEEYAGITAETDYKIKWYFAELFEK